MQKTFLALLVVFACLAGAQIYTTGAPISESVAFRLVQKAYQAELGISADQAKSISAISEAFEQDSRSIQGGEGTKFDQLQSSAAKKIISELTASQRARLRELAIQEVGPFALRDADVSKEVGISASQKTAIESISKKTASDLDALGVKIAAQIDKLPSNAPETKRREIGNAFIAGSKRIEDEGAAKILALLTSAQKAKWKAIQGKPFKA